MTGDSMTGSAGGARAWLPFLARYERESGDHGHLSNWMKKAIDARWPGRPTDLPAIREQMVNLWLDQKSVYWLMYLNMNNKACYPESTPDIGLRESTLWWVSEQMTDVVEDVAPSVPEDTSLTAELLPSPSGLIVFQKPMRSIDVYVKEDYISVDAYSWRPQRGGLAISAYKWIPVGINDRLGGKFCYIGGTNWGFNQTLGEAVADVSSEGMRIEMEASSLEDLTRLIATMAVAFSPGVVDLQKIQADRSARRRARRAGITDDSAVRVIYMSHSSAGGHGDGDSNYHHRWVVSGHWRSQPYGPGRTLRRPVWIAPHVKGPEGAPLLGGEKVRAVVR